MEFAHATLTDLGRFAAAAGLFPLVLAVPGFVAGWVLNPLNFRREPLSGQLALAVLTGVALGPVLGYWLGRFGPPGAVWAWYGLTWAALPVVLWLRGRRERVPDPNGWAFPLAGLAWAVVVAAVLPDLQVGDSLYRPIQHYDYTKHALVIDALANDGVPPTNPCFREAGAKVPLPYYYFWHLLAAHVRELGGSLTDARLTAVASAAWAGVAVLAALRVFLARGFVPAADRTRYWLAFGLLLVTGLDLLPTLLRPITRPDPSFPLFDPSVEWWNETVPNWPGRALWTPHDAAGVAAAAFALLLLREAAGPGSWTGRLRAAAVAGAAVASCVGMDVWFGMVTVAAVAAWWALAAVLGWKTELPGPVVAGVLAGALVLPFAAELVKASGEAGQFPLAATVRPFRIIDPTLEHFNTGQPLTTVFHLLLLPFGYAIELGGLAFGGWIYWQRRRALGLTPTRDEWCLVAFAAVALLLCTFVKSALRNNDFGFRGLGFVQLALLLWTLPVLTDSVPPGDPAKGAKQRTLLRLLLLIGVGGTVYDLGMNRTVVWGPDPRTALGLRQTYEWVDANAPPAAVVQQSWVRPAAQREWEQLKYREGEAEFFHLLYGHRPAVASDWMHGCLFGVSVDRFDAVGEPLRELFEKPLTPAEVKERCKAAGIAVLVVKATDPVWLDPTGWPHQLSPAFRNGMAAVFLMP